MMGKRKRDEVEQEEVDLDAPCAVCQDAQDTEENDMIYCDLCPSCYHYLCLTPPLTRMPLGQWVCPRCRSGDGRGPSYRHAKGRGADRRARREDPSSGLPARGEKISQGDLETFLLCRWAASTKKKYEKALERYVDCCERHGREEEDADSLAIYVMDRVRDGVSAETIRGETVGVQQLRPELREVLVAKQALQAAVRLCDKPRKDKLPVTPDLLKKLGRSIKKWESPLGSEYSKRVQNRDWAYYLLAYLGFFRGAEVLDLRWSDLRFSWKRDEGRTEETSEPAPSNPSFKPLAVTVVVRESKADRAGEGRVVRLAASTDDKTLHFCPVRVLQHLWNQCDQRRRGFIIADERAQKKYLGNQLSTSTLRSRLKEYLGDSLTEEELDDYSLHSFRKGGATAAARLGRPMREIKLQGGWKSDVAFAYTLASDQDRLALTAALLDEIKSKK